MKANESPEKLYLLPNGLISYCRNTDEDVEYTRTDYAKKRFIVDAKIFLSEIHRVCDITDENGYRIELRDLQAIFENFINEKLL